MGVGITGGTSGVTAEVGAAAAAAQHTTSKPIPHGALGHYRSTARFAIVASQAANSRLWQIRNTGANLIVPTRLEVWWTHTAAHTAAILAQLALYRATTFTAVDPTGTPVTPGTSVKRTAGMAAAPGGAAIRHVPIAGLAAGITGGTLTKDAATLATVEQWMLLAQPTAGVTAPLVKDMLNDDAAHGEHPLVLAQNEGLSLENVVALGVAAGSSVVVDFSWAEVTAY